MTHQEPPYGQFIQQNLSEQVSRASWHGSTSNGTSSARGGHFQSMNKPQVAATFSYSRNNNTNQTNFPVRGRGIGRNFTHQH
jgi:hypothetical protein